MIWFFGPIRKQCSIPSAHLAAGWCLSGVPGITFRFRCSQERQSHPWLAQDLTRLEISSCTTHAQQVCRADLPGYLDKPPIPVNNDHAYCTVTGVVHPIDPAAHTQAQRYLSEEVLLFPLRSLTFEMNHFQAAFQSPFAWPPSFHLPTPRCSGPKSRLTTSRRVIRCELRPGNEVTGRVTNITPYGAFVDLGVYGHGLIHISQISDSFVSSVSSYLSVNDRVRVRVLSVDPATNRIALSIKPRQPSRATGYDRVVQLGGDWGHPWNDDGQTRYIDMGPRPKGPEAWESDPTLFEEWQEKSAPQSDE